LLGQATGNLGTATLLEAEAAALYTMFANKGSGKLDFSAIIKMLRGTC
jgi:3-hydroxyisobutyrate dehydrogenase